MPGSGPAPADQAARDRIRTDLASTLFVEAGAGSGKTSALVERVVALVVGGVTELDGVAAITFTEKAAAELRDRIRTRLEEGSVAEDPLTASRCRAALDQIDTAAIGTLHAFARRILAEHAIAAGLPPRIDVLDEVSSGLASEQRWAALRDHVLEAGELARPVLLLLALGVPLDALRYLASAFDDNWDLVQDRVPASAPDPPPVADLVLAALAPLDELCARRHTECTDDTDKLCGSLEAIEVHLTRLRAGVDDEAELVRALHDAELPSFKVGNVGRKASWTDLAELRQAVGEAGEILPEVRRHVGQACIEQLAPVVRASTLDGARRRREDGRLEYHDLLVLSRQLLTDPHHGPAVRSALHRRYRHILLDEFQDTDPIQIDLAVRIAAADPGSAEAGSRPWAEVDVEPGHLFVVGDPKQSIYRFRRADISLWMAARARYGPPTGGAVELTSNFRTVEAVTDWVNATFAALLGEAPSVATPGPSQPAYLALAAHRRGAPDGPPVVVLGRTGHLGGTKADAVRSAEAADVAATVVRALDEAWTVQGEDGGWRPARLGDITVLVPARTSLPFLEDELGRAGIPFRAESSSLVYASRAVRDVMMVLRAVDDPTDHLRIVSALRTPLFACGDDDLHCFRVERHGSWSYLADQPATVPADDPVGAGLAYLRRLHDSRHWRAPSEVLDQVIRDRRVLELEAADPRARDVWRRLRFVVDQARGWNDAAGGGLRDYVQWVERQGTDGIRVAEAVLPETDDDAVRIMTIHAAKGLEFPVTIVSGLSTQPQRRPAPAEVVWTDDGVGYLVAGGVQTDEWQEYAPIDEQMSADERKRLLYVACTRARDHLVVSLHRVVRRNPPDANKRTNAELLVDAMGPRLGDLPEVVATGEEILGPLSPPAAVAGSPPDWAATRDAALERASRPVAVAATALTADGEAAGDGATDGEGAGGTVEPGLQKRPRDLDLPPWLKGRYGTAVGRAVHGVLQTVDLATGAGLDAAVAAQCEAEAVPDRAGEVATLARHALGSPVVREAASRPHWRELYVATPLEDGPLLEGYVDLLYRGDDGLVVVDYKTAHTADPGVLRTRVEGYRWQGRAYARAVAAVTGEAVAGVVFLFLTPDGAIEWPDGGGGDHDGSDAGHVGPVVTR